MNHKNVFNTNEWSELRKKHKISSEKEDREWKVRCSVVEIDSRIQTLTLYVKRLKLSLIIQRWSCCITQWLAIFCFIRC